MSIRSVMRFIVAGLFLGAPVTAFAGTDTANLGVSAEVTANCTISTSPLAFGNYDPVDANAAAALNGTGTVTVTCTDGASAQIELDQGANADAGSTAEAPLRRLTGGGEFLSYSLFSDSGRTTVWATGAAVDVEHTGTGTAANLTVYGSIAAGQNVGAESYSDTVVATVTF